MSYREILAKNAQLAYEDYKGKIKQYYFAFVIIAVIIVIYATLSVAATWPVDGEWVLAVPDMSAMQRTASLMKLRTGNGISSGESAYVRALDDTPDENTDDIIVSVDLAGVRSADGTTQSASNGGANQGDQGAPIDSISEKPSLKASVPRSVYLKSSAWSQTVDVMSDLSGNIIFKGAKLDTPQFFLAGKPAGFVYNEGVTSSYSTGVSGKNYASFNFALPRPILTIPYYGTYMQLPAGK